MHFQCAVAPGLTALRRLISLSADAITRKMRQSLAWMPEQNARREDIGAGDESRTRDLNLGKVALYQLSYSRIAKSANSTQSNNLVKA